MFCVLRAVLLGACFTGLFSASSMAVSSGNVGANVPAAEDLLVSLASALRAKNYQGDFTFEHGSRMESFRISHGVVNGNEMEHLYQLSGKEEQVLHTGRPVTCGTLGSMLLGGGRLHASGVEVAGLDRHYQAAVVGTDRVAGRSAWVVNLMPKDTHRYAVSLAIDTKTHLLLRYVVLDTQKKSALERLQFVSLSAHNDAQILIGETSANHLVEFSQKACVYDVYSARSLSPWRPHWIPSGFVLVDYGYSELNGHRETYTDGLSSFSVFVNPLNASAAREPQLEGVATRGATTTLIRAVVLETDTLTVSFVGELPLGAAKKISASIRRYSIGSIQ